MDRDGNIGRNVETGRATSLPRVRCGELTLTLSGHRRAGHPVRDASLGRNGMTRATQHPVGDASLKRCNPDGLRALPCPQRRHCGLDPQPPHPTTADRVLRPLSGCAGAATCRRQGRKTKNKPKTNQKYNH